MNAGIYLQVNLIPVIALIMMRVNTGRSLSYSWRNRCLRFIMVILAAVMVANTAAWTLDGRQLPGVRISLWIFNSGYFALMDFAAFLWFLYVYDILHNGIGQRGKRVLLPAMPLLVFLAVLATNPWTHLIFCLDEQNCYVRGRAFLLHILVAAGYLAAASFTALFHCAGESTKERKSECRWLAGFAVLPLVGGLLQLFFYGVELLLPFTAASILMVYINVQQKQVTRDALTGLNNRGRLDEYLRELDEQNWGEESCYFILLDVDKFKKINDTFGHVTGDAVLRQVADQLKKVFGGSRSFLARYGGDEFVIILRGKTGRQVEEEIAELKNAVAGMDWMNNGCPWKISLSVGCARYGEIAMDSVNELVVLADTRMYEQKKRNRQKEISHTTDSV